MWRTRSSNFLLKERIEYSEFGKHGRWRETKKYNHLLKSELQKYNEDDLNSKGQMEDNIEESQKTIVGLRI